MSGIVDQEKIPAESDWSTVTPIAGIDVATGDGKIYDMPSEETTKLGDPTLSSDDARRTVSGFKWFLVCISLYFSALIYGLDTTVAADIQGAVVDTFEDIGQLTWIGTGFPMGSVCAILPAASLYSRFDMKKLFLGSVVLFEVGSAICGAAPTMDALIVGRVIAGVGGSGLYIGLLNYFSILTTEKERGGYMGVIGLVWGLGAILGPVVGGGFSISSATWRWSFYINLFVAAICAPVYIIYLPSILPADDGNSLTKLFNIDWTGIILNVGTLVSLVMVLTFAGSTWQWNDGRTIALFVVFGALLSLLIVQQRFNFLTSADNRMFPPGRLLRSRSQLLLNIEMFCFSAAIFVPLYYIPNYFQFVHSDSAIMAAVRLLPFVIVLVVTNIFSGILLPKIGYYPALYFASGILITIGSSLMFTITLDSSAPHIYGYSVLIAFGCGISFNLGYTIAGVKVSLRGGSAHDVNLVVTMQNISQIGGTLMSLLISGQVFQSYTFKNLKVVLRGEGLTDDQIRSCVAGTRSTIFASLSPELATGATEAITKAISKLYVLVIVAGGLSLLCSVFMKQERLFK